MFRVTFDWATGDHGDTQTVATLEEALAILRDAAPAGNEPVEIRPGVWRIDCTPFGVQRSCESVGYVHEVAA